MAGHSRRKLDLTGERYGRLTVVAPAPNIGKRTAWLCRCDCGKMATARTDHLRDGHVSSCGCLCRDGIIQRSRSQSCKGGHPEGLNTLHFIDGTCVEMLRSNTIRRNNTSGVTGVEWRKSKHRWRASICFKGTRYYLGMYERFDDAVQARKKAEAETHGAFLAYIDSLDAGVSGL